MPQALLCSSYIQSYRLRLLNLPTFKFAVSISDTILLQITHVIFANILVITTTNQASAGLALSLP